MGPDTTAGPVSHPVTAELGLYQTMEIDCPQILELLEGTEFLEAQFLKGFVTIETEVELQVEAVYTTAQVQQLEECGLDTISLNTGYDQGTGSLLGDEDPDDDWDLTNSLGDPSGSPPGAPLGNAKVQVPFPKAGYSYSFGGPQ